MHVALVRQRYSAHGGAERFIERALAALGKQGVTVTVLAREWIGDPGSVVRCDPFHVGRVWRDWSFARAVCREIARRPFDFVQSHERIACCDIYRAGDGVHAQWLRNRRAVLGPLARVGVALNPYHRYVLAAEQRLFASPRLRAVICNSRMVRDEIRAHFGTPDAKLHVIYNGIDLEAFHPRLREVHRSTMRQKLDIPQHVPVHLHVGAGFERKGVFRLIEAFARSGQHDAHLVIVGRDKAQARAERLASSHGIASRVHFAGAQENVGPWYGAADAFALASLYDPFPNAALEAMACGLPVITTPQCGTAELIDEGVNGYVVDALAVDELADRLARLEVPAAREMGRLARERAEGFSLRAMAARLLALYRSLAAT
ncbi:MAG: glycosyltransferase family 4 protein [Betaproteobacteria bacterium]|nr:MAG: glycosyltransferase family 4 protein [Betaproteobacteria bacterium]